MEISIERRIAAILAHSGSWLFLNYGAPFLIPLLIMLYARGKKDSFLAEHARQSLNFALSLALFALVLIVLGFGFTVAVSGDARPSTASIGVLFLYIPMILMGVTAVVLEISAAKAAHRGDAYRYPVALEFVRPPQQD